MFISLHPQLLLNNSTTTGGDTGAHFIVPYFASKDFFSKWSLTGWSPVWYDGFPLLTFYFPLPSLLVALASHVIPYGIAFKMVTILGSLLIPPAFYTLGKAAKLNDPYPAVFAIGSLAFLYDATFSIDGGNLLSTLAGEYSFSLSLALGIFFLACVVRGLNSPRRIAIASLLFGLTALSHLLPAFFVAGLAIVYELTGRKLKSILRLALVGLLGTGVIALWIVPFAINLVYTTSMGWTKVTTYMASLAPSSLRIWLVLALLGTVLSFIRHRRLGMTLAIVGALSAVAFVVFPQGAVYNARMIPFYVLSVYLLAAVAVAEISILVPDIVASLRSRRSTSRLKAQSESDTQVLLTIRDPDSPLSESTAGISLDDLPVEIDGVQSISQNLTRSEAKIHKVAAFIGALVLLGVFSISVVPQLRNPSLCNSSKLTAACVPVWATWNYTGYEGKQAWPEYMNIMSSMKAIGQQYGCGRAMWEYNSDENSFGTPMALMLLPYWTGGCVDSMEGLFFESSATTPYHFINQSELSTSPSNAMDGLPYAGLNMSLGIKHLQLLGVRYYMAFSPTVVAKANANRSLQLIRTIKPVNPSAGQSSLLGQTWNIYLVKSSSLVEPLQQTPVVWKGLQGGKSDWLKYSVAWYDNPSHWSILRAQNGPSGWSRISPGAAAPAEPLQPPIKVTDIQNKTSSISFRVSKTGVPVLVKVSYFPNWKAVGATGPYRVAPNLMVVIPTHNQVTLNYGHTPIDTGSEIFSVVVIFGLTFFAVLPESSVRRFSRRRSA